MALDSTSLRLLEGWRDASRRAEAPLLCMHYSIKHRSAFKCVEELRTLREQTLKLLLEAKSESDTE